MATASSIDRKTANQGGEARFVNAKGRSEFFGQVVEIIRRAWPRKTVANVAHITGVSERSVQFWLAGQTNMSIENVAALLRTDAGYDILIALMGDAEPAWWVLLKLAYKIRQSKRVIAAEKKRTEELRALQAQIDLFEQQ